MTESCVESGERYEHNKTKVGLENFWKSSNSQSTNQFPFVLEREKWGMALAFYVFIKVPFRYRYDVYQLNVELIVNRI